MPTHHTPIHLAAAELVATRAGIAATDIKVDATPKPELGDLAVGCFAIAKARGAKPNEVAAEIAAAFQPTHMLASAIATGPFVNFRIDRAAAYRWMIDAALRGTLVPSRVGEGQTICIDYSSPNISKHLAYHHIRSTVIGHALAQIFRALGYRVVGINHLGDWGTTHGMLLAAWALWGPIEPLDITKLNDLYVKFREAAKENPALEDQARMWFKRLEAGDEDARALWQRFRDVSWAEFQIVYDRLGIAFTEVRGESAYEPDLPRVMKELRAKGLVTESEGAQVVELPGEKTPILLETRDGTTLYATRDAASAEYRWNTYHFARSLYVVDRGQALHFRQLFKLLAKMGHEWAGRFTAKGFETTRCEHVPFGLVRLGGKKTGTRSGNVVLLKDVLDEAETDVRAVIAKVNSTLPADVLDRVAPIVGIGAVMFANLVAQREKDVDFEWEKVIALSGDSGPYVQYSHARCASIMRKAGEVIDRVDGIDFSPLLPGAPWEAARLAELDTDAANATDDDAKRRIAELRERIPQYADAAWAIARRLLELPDMVVRAGEGCEPHIICHYLLQLAGDFSYWYTLGNSDGSLRVLCDDPATRRARLALVAGVQATLATGLGLLGIGAPDQM